MIFPVVLRNSYIILKSCFLYICEHAFTNYQHIGYDFQKMTSYFYFIQFRKNKKHGTVRLWDENINEERYLTCLQNNKQNMSLLQLQARRILQKYSCSIYTENIKKVKASQPTLIQITIIETTNYDFQQCFEVEYMSAY